MKTWRSSIPATLCGLAVLSASGVQAKPAQTSTVSAEVAALCAESIALAGVEADMDARIRAATNDIHTRLEAISPAGDQSLQAYNAALDEALQAAKGPILDRLGSSCAAAFTADELREINRFYASAAGQAWLNNGRTIIMPALEAAVAEARPNIRDDIERRYCERLGC